MILLPAQFGVPVNSDLRLYITLTGTPAPYTVVIKGLIRQPDGNTVPFDYNMVVTNDSIGTNFRFPLSEGHLLSFTLDAPWMCGVDGQVYAKVTIGQNVANQYDTRMILFAGYIQNYTYQGFPFSQQHYPTFHRGWMHSVVVQVPGPGDDFFYTIPAGKFWILHGIHFILTTSVAVPVRNIFSGFTDLTPVNFLLPVGTQAASLIRAYNGLNSPAATIALSAVIYFPIFQNTPLRQGHQIFSFTENIDADDQYSAIVLYVEEFQNHQG